MGGASGVNIAIESSEQFLEAVYDTLGYRDGDLLSAVLLPEAGGDEAKQWLEKGEWLATAKKVNAKKVFFVRNDPVIVFSEFEQVPTESELLNLFRRVWCMARPQRLFLALPGELRVYGLNQPPPDGIAEEKTIEPLVTVTKVADVLEKLQAYRREQLESGYLPQACPDEERFGLMRADRRLIQDLKAVRHALIDAGLKAEHAHALIGRSIFIRYLEDRGVLTEQYFLRIAQNHPHWEELLSQPSRKPAIIQDEEWEKRRYVRVLRDKEFTYALFLELANDFNGDLFPKDEFEQFEVQPKHLDLLRRFLLGDTDPQQPRLFFWAYNFEIIPLDLISSIYEEFYHQTQRDDKGTHYTPSVLVEFVLSQLLPPERLAEHPKILDPACGSGIFLVECFRRMVRYRVQTLGRALSAKELREILRDQIRGVEINQGAAYVAAFSLYLALLHYQKSPDILAQIETSDSDSKPLPNLIYAAQSVGAAPQDANHYQVIFNTNAFALMDAEREQLKDLLSTSRRFKGRSQIKKLYESSAVLPLEAQSFDVIVGNPPWGFVKNASSEIKKAQTQAKSWCEGFGWSIGYKELSQAFIARTFSLLKAGGECGLLVSTGVFLKRHSRSQLFRQRWLEESTLKTIVNFSHVRDMFFSQAIAPFAFVHYEASPADFRDSRHSGQWVRYWSAKRSEGNGTLPAQVVLNPAITLRLSDLRRVRQRDLKRNEQLWKTYWWGNHRDAALIDVLQLDQPLGELANQRGWFSGSGFKGPVSGLPNEDSGWLSGYLELPVQEFHRYRPIDHTKLVPVPEAVNRRRDPRLYEGWRLLIKEGINQAKGANGRIEARLESEKYAYRHSIYGIQLTQAEDWERKVLIGILWSSLARYYFFMTASSWGTWFHKISLSGLKELPVRFPNDSSLRQRIVRLVDELNLPPAGHDALGKQADKKRVALLEKELDEAIFELYELSELERDLVLDMCHIGLEFFYRHSKSQAVQKVEAHPKEAQGTIVDLPQRREVERGVEGYLYAFLDMWNDEFDDGELRWRVIQPKNNPMLAVLFVTQWEGAPLPEIESSDDEEWERILLRCAEASRQPISRNIYIDGLVRIVTDTEIFIIKRNERRLWTRSQAREDAEATILQAMYLQEAAQEE